MMAIGAYGPCEISHRRKIYRNLLKRVGSADVETKEDFRMNRVTVSVYDLPGAATLRSSLAGERDWRLIVTLRLQFHRLMFLMLSIGCESQQQGRIESLDGL